MNLLVYSFSFPFTSTTFGCREEVYESTVAIRFCIKVATFNY